MKQSNFTFLKASLLVIFFQFASPSFAQKTVSFDFYAGPSLTWTRTNESKSTTSKIGYSAGVGVRKDMSARVALSAKLLYEKKRAEFTRDPSYWFIPDTDPLIVTNAKTKISYDMFTIPLQVRVSTGGKKAAFFTELGPYVSYLMGQKTKELGDSTTTGKAGYKNFSLGLASAIGLSVVVSPKVSIQTQMLNTFCITNVRKDEYYSTQRPQALALLFGISRKI